MTNLNRSTLTEFLLERQIRANSNPAPPEKYFLWTDKTGRGEKALKIPGILRKRTGQRIKN